MKSLIKDQKPPLASNFIDVDDERLYKLPTNPHKLRMAMKKRMLNEWRRKEKVDREIEVKKERQKWLNNVFQPLPRANTPQPSSQYPEFQAEAPKDNFSIGSEND